jgi:hypothetical protein
MNILVYKKKCRECKNGLSKSTNHIFCMIISCTSNLQNFEHNEYKKLTKLFNKGMISFMSFYFKISRLWNFHMILKNQIDLRMTI